MYKRFTPAAILTINFDTAHRLQKHLTMGQVQEEISASTIRQSAFTIFTNLPVH
jgi:hypothetical protein